MENRWKVRSLVRSSYKQRKMIIKMIIKRNKQRRNLFTRITKEIQRKDKDCRLSKRELRKDTKITRKRKKKMEKPRTSVSEKEDGGANRSVQVEETLARKKGVEGGRGGERGGGED